MRSRDTGVGRRRNRDLIEAGLSDPARWRGRLWGLCLWRPVRDPASGEAREALGRLVAIDEDGWGRWIDAKGVELTATGGVPAQCRFGAAATNETIPASAIGARRRKSGAAEPPMHQELSFQNDERQGVTRSKMPRMTMAPPQHGHRSSLRSGRVSCNCSTVGSGDGALSSRRHSASLPARWPLARKP